jgi:predicted dehydrogenase
LNAAHVPALKALGPLAPSLKAIYSRSKKSASELQDEVVRLLHSRPDIYHDSDPSANLDALLARSDISSVIVVLPITLQPEIILKALAAGKHVISEKPVAPDVASGLKLIAIYEAEYKPKGLVWRVSENWEAEPGYRSAAQAIRAGKIGKVIFYNLRNVSRIDKDSMWYKTPWRTVPDVSLSNLHRRISKI